MVIYKYIPLIESSFVGESLACILNALFMVTNSLWRERGGTLLSNWRDATGKDLNAPVHILKTSF